MRELLENSSENKHKFYEWNCQPVDSRHENFPSNVRAFPACNTSMNWLSQNKLVSVTLQHWSRTVRQNHRSNDKIKKTRTGKKLFHLKNEIVGRKKKSLSSSVVFIDGKVGIWWIEFLKFNYTFSYHQFSSENTSVKILCYVSETAATECNIMIYNSHKTNKLASTNDERSNRLIMCVCEMRRFKIENFLFLLLNLWSMRLCPSVTLLSMTRKDTHFNA